MKANVEFSYLAWNRNQQTDTSYHPMAGFCLWMEFYTISVF